MWADKRRREMLFTPESLGEQDRFDGSLRRELMTAQNGFTTTRTTMMNISTVGTSFNIRQ